MLLLPNESVKSVCPPSMGKFGAVVAMLASKRVASAQTLSALRLSILTNVS
jgi:hypothetical protein